jgi:hypothetical protein
VALASSVRLLYRQRHICSMFCAVCLSEFMPVVRMKGLHPVLSVSASFCHVLLGNEADLSAVLVCESENVLGPFVPSHHACPVLQFFFKITT